MLFLKINRINFIILIFLTATFFSCKKDKIIAIGAIVGASTVCYVDSNIVYSIPLNPEADYVLWTVPEQAQIVSGQGTNIITVIFGRKAGNICAKYYNKGKEVSTASCLEVHFDISNNWCREIDFKGGKRAFAKGFSIGNKGYLATGFDLGNKKDLWEFDPELVAWTQKADFGGVERTAAVAFSIGNKGYLGTGYTGTAVLKDFWEYDPDLNTWTQKADCDTARQYAFGFSIGNKGYVGSGNKTPGTVILTADFREYDPATDQWVKKADAIKRNGASSFSIGNKGYVGVGNNSSTIPQRDFREYDPSDTSLGFDINHNPMGKWILRDSLPGPPRYIAFGFSIGNKGYIGSGSASNTSGYYTDFWEYDPYSNSWTQKKPITGKRAYAASFAIRNKGYIGTGALEANFYSDWWVYTQ